MECIKLTLKDADLLAKNFRKMLEGACKEVEKAERDYKVIGMIPKPIALMASKDIAKLKGDKYSPEELFERTVKGCENYRKMCQEIKEEYTKYLELVTLGSEEFR